MGRGRFFFRHKKASPTFWAEGILILRVFIFLIFLGPKFLAWAPHGPTHLIAGKNELINSIKNFSIFRTYRCSDIVLYELQKTTELYIQKNEEGIPFWNLLKKTYSELESRFEKITGKSNIKHKIINGESLIGGGTLPNITLSSPVMVLDVDKSENILMKLISNEYPIIPRVIDGKINKITEKFVFLFIEGLKSEPVLDINELKSMGLADKIKVGETISVLLEKIEDKNGEVLVSASKAQKIKGWDKLVQAYEKNEPIMGKITSKCKGGCIVEHIDTGSLMFLPGSQISDKPSSVPVTPLSCPLQMGKNSGE